MNFLEAMKIVDAGGIVARESQWEMTKAGFAWGPWCRQIPTYTTEDRKRAQTEMNVAPSGPLRRAVHTLCETVVLLDGDDSWWGDVARDAVDWVDVTDRFESGSPKGWFEHMHGP